MKPRPNTKPSPAKRNVPPLLAIIVGLVVVICLVCGGIALYSSLTTKSTANYAEEVAKPLEAGLVKAGGVKKCSMGDAGRGSDNDKPWYQTYFEAPLNREQAIATINKIASDNGYSLSHASIANRGPVTVDDLYIDNWFYNTTSKMSQYKDLQHGDIELFFTVNNNGPLNLACGADGKAVSVNNGADSSAISIRIGLPRFVR